MIASAARTIIIAGCRFIASILQYCQIIFKMIEAFCPNVFGQRESTTGQGNSGIGLPWKVGALRS